MNPIYCDFEAIAIDSDHALYVCRNTACGKSMTIPVDIGGPIPPRPVALCRVQLPDFKMQIATERPLLVVHTPHSLPCALRREKAASLTCLSCNGKTSRQIPVYICLKFGSCTINFVGNREVDGRIPHVCNGCTAIAPPVGP